MMARKWPIPIGQVIWASGDKCTVDLGCGFLTGLTKTSGILETNKTSSARTLYMGGGRTPTSRDSGWYKCPYCGRRQNIKDDGGNCLSCNGDVMAEVV